MRSSVHLSIHQSLTLRKLETIIACNEVQQLLEVATSRKEACTKAVHPRDVTSEQSGYQMANRSRARQNNIFHPYPIY
jgi:uncharacterized MAPEG superfamily protein